MKGRFLVCPLDEDLYFRLGAESSIVPVVHSVQFVGRAAEAVRQAGAHLHCIWVRESASLARLQFSPQWESIPIALEVPEMGRFTEVRPLLEPLRRMNLRVYLPTTDRENYSALRILSSMGVETGVVFDPEGLDWDLTADLMTYTLFGRRPHAPVAPFSSLIGRWKPTERVLFGQHHFDHPEVYLHLDGEGRVALSQRDLAEDRFVAASVEELDGAPDGNERYRAERMRWREFFLKAEGCSCCPGWRLCGGAFAGRREADPRCGEFFREWMDGLERNPPVPERKKWQP